MISKQLSDEFIVFLKQYLSFYQEFLELETKKHEVITQNNRDELDHYVTKEQAYLLKSKGIESRRDDILNSCGFKDYTLHDFIPKLDPSVQEIANTLYLKLSDVLLDFKSINSRCNSLIELRLHKINNQIQQLEKEGKLPQSYNNNAKTGNAPINIISKKI